MPVRAPENDGEITTYSALAREFNRKGGTVKAWTQREDWPDGIKRFPPWGKSDMPSIRAFVENLRRSPNPRGGRGRKSVEQKTAEERLTEARAAKAEFEVAKAKKLYVRRADVERRSVAAIRAICAELESMADSLPSELRAEPESEWSNLMRRRFNEMRERFALNVGVVEEGGKE